MRLTSRFPPRLTPRFPSRFAPQELTPSNLSLLRPGLLAAGYRAPFEQPLNQRSYNGQEAYFAALTTRAPPPGIAFMRVDIHAGIALCIHPLNPKQIDCQA